MLRRDRPPVGPTLLLARQHELRVIDDGLATPGWPGCLFVGAPGVGTSRFGREVVERLQGRGRSATIISGRLAAARHRFGDAVSTHQGSPSPPPAIVVDDIHELDALGWAILADAHREAGTVVIGTAKAGRLDHVAGTHELVALGIECHPLAPLDEAATLALYAALTGRAPTRPSLHRWSAGRPALIVEAAVASAMADRGQAPLSGLSRLDTLVNSWLAQLGPDAGATARLLAISGPLPIELLARLGSATTAASLELAGLARSSRAASSLTIELHPPAVTEALTSSIGAVERHVILSRFAAAFDPSDPPEYAVVAVSLAARGGPLPSPSTLRRAAHWAIAHGDAQLADVVATIGAEVARREVNVPAEVEAFGFAPTRDADVEPSSGITHGEEELLRVVHLASWAPDPAPVIAATRALLSRGGLDDRVRLSAEALACELASLEGDARDAADQATELAREGERLGLALPSLTILTAYLRGLAGPLPKRTIEAAPSPADDELNGARRLFAVFLYDLMSGRGLDRWVAPDDGFGPATRSPVGVLLFALAAAMSGDASAAQRALGQSMRTARETRGHARVIDALRRAIAAELGQPSPRASERPDGPNGSRGTAWLRLAGVDAYAAAWRTLTAPGSRLHNARELNEQIRMLAACDGERAWAILALVVACRFDCAEPVVGLIGELASEYEGPLSRQVHSHALALVAGDAGQLRAVARWYRQTGLRPLAAESFEAAARRFDRSGATTSAARCRLERDAAHPAAASPALGGLPPVLTESEVAVVRRLGAGSSNRAIAQQLFLSTRTVENHLHRVYKRLGVDGRSELIALRDGVGLASAAAVNADEA